MTVVKNRLLKQIVRYLPVPKHKPKEEKRILVIATTALGDTLWATPALASLKKSFPNSYIAVLTSPIGFEVLKHNPSIDRLHLLRDHRLSRSFSLWRTLYKEQFDTVLLFHASQRFILPLAALLGASQIVGTAGLNKGLDSLLTHPLPNQYQHEIVRRLKIIEAIGARVSTEKLALFLQPEEEHPPLPKGTWVALHPGSKDPFKRWPAKHFVALGRRLKEEMGCEILITGSKGEQELMEQIGGQIPGAKVGDPHLPLRAFGALLKQIDLLITNDTGPLHLAAALERPFIGIYSSTDPSLCGPHQAERATVLYKKRTCEPCLKKRCRSPFCLLQIGVAEVAEAAQAHLAKRKILKELREDLISD